MNATSYRKGSPARRLAEGLDRSSPLYIPPEMVATAKRLIADGFATGERVEGHRYYLIERAR